MRGFQHSWKKKHSHTAKQWAHLHLGKAHSALPKIKTRRQWRCVGVRLSYTNGPLWLEAENTRSIPCALSLMRVGPRAPRRSLSEQTETRAEEWEHTPCTAEGRIKVCKTRQKSNSRREGGETVRGFFQSAHTHFCRELYHFRALKKRAKQAQRDAPTHRLLGSRGGKNEKEFQSVSDVYFPQGFRENKRERDPPRFAMGL